MKKYFNNNIKLNNRAVSVKIKNNAIYCIIIDDNENIGYFTIYKNKKIIYQYKLTKDLLYSYYDVDDNFGYFINPATGLLIRLKIATTKIEKINQFSFADNIYLINNFYVLQTVFGIYLYDQKTHQLKFFIDNKSNVGSLIQLFFDDRDIYISGFPSEYIDKLTILAINHLDSINLRWKIDLFGELHIKSILVDNNLIVSMLSIKKNTTFIYFINKQSGVVFLSKEYPLNMRISEADDNSYLLYGNDSVEMIKLPDTVLWRLNLPQIEQVLFINNYLFVLCQHKEVKIFNRQGDFVDSFYIDNVEFELLKDDVNKKYLRIGNDLFW